MFRFPVVSGRFYPGTKAFLEERIQGMIDAKAAPEEALGIICPHAGYNFSGEVAAAETAVTDVKASPASEPPKAPPEPGA